MDKKIIVTKDAPAAIGPYAQAVQVGQMLYTSGQIPLDPTTGELVADDIKAQTEQVLKNLQAVLQAAGSSWANVVKATIFLTDLADFAVVNACYQSKLVAPYPARSCVQVAALPRGAKIEIEVIARIA
ncbi:MAG: RidA family protein [Hyphomonadaceae bacterium]|nr:RidA family protein [Clostridia bacterium]